MLERLQKILSARIPHPNLLPPRSKRVEGVLVCDRFEEGRRDCVCFVGVCFFDEKNNKQHTIPPPLDPINQGSEKAQHSYCKGGGG